MLRALYYCHKIIKVIHRDIKPDNIMINHNNEAVLIDFGVCELVDQQEDDVLTKKKGSYMFFAPEMFKEDKYIKGESTDIWALGVTLFYLVTGHFPFDEEQNLMRLHDMVLNDPINFDLIKNENLRNLLERILEKDPDHRATLEEILQNQWVTSNGRNIIELKEVEVYENGLGNIDRLLLKSRMKFGMTSMQLFRDQLAEIDDIEKQIISLSEKM